MLTQSSSTPVTCKEAREILYNEFHAEISLMANDLQEKEIVIAEESAFYTKIDDSEMSAAYLGRHLVLIDIADDVKLAKMRKKIYTRYHQEFWTSIHQEIFSPNRYHAFQLEMEYLKHHIVKPFDVTVRKAIQRIDVLLKYLPFYPPRTLRDKRLTMADWSTFSDMKHVTEEDKRDIQDNKDKLKSAKDEDANANRNQKSVKKKYKNNGRDKNSTTHGVAHFYEMCKASGAPTWVYENHNSADCKKKDKKKDKYAKLLLSGGAGQKEKAKQEYKAFKKCVEKSDCASLKKEKIKNKKYNNDTYDDMSVKSKESNIAY